MLYYKPIDNSALVVPTYTELTAESLYPCNTERLRYDKDDHRYYLTEAALSHYGINFDPQRVKWLIRKATEHIYSYIALMAQTKYNLMCYRIAKSNFGCAKSKKEGRREVEEKLALQADYINEWGDAKKTSKMVVSPETGRLKDNDVDMSSGFWLDDEVLNWLNVNYLTDPNAIYNPWDVKWNEY